MASKTIINKTSDSDCSETHHQKPLGANKTIHVQEQIIEQLRLDQYGLREALEEERMKNRTIILEHDKELKSLQRETIQQNKIIKTQELKIDELEEQVRSLKDVLATEQKNINILEKEHFAQIKEISLKHSKDYDKANRLEVINDQIKSELEQTKQLLENERNATSYLIREHNTEVKQLREELKAMTNEAYKEFKERATRERDEYRAMQLEAEKTYVVLEKDFRAALAAKDEEIKQLKSETRAAQRDLEDQLRQAVKAVKPTFYKEEKPSEYEQIRRLKNELNVLRDQNKKLLNQLQEMTEDEKTQVYEIKNLESKHGQELIQQTKAFQKEVNKMLAEMKSKDKKLAKLERKAHGLRERVRKQNEKQRELQQVIKNEVNNKRSGIYSAKMVQPSQDENNSSTNLPHVKDIIRKLQEKEKSCQRPTTVPRRKLNRFREPMVRLQDPPGTTHRTIEDLKSIDRDVEKLKTQIEERDKIILALREAAEMKDRKFEELLMLNRKEHTSSPGALESSNEANERGPAIPSSPSPPLCQGGLCWADDFANKAYHEPVYAQLLKDHRTLKKSFSQLQEELTRVKTENDNLMEIKNSLSKNENTEKKDNGINVILAEQIRKLKDRESELVMETQDLKEQNDLLEFRILELEEYKQNEMTETKSRDNKNDWMGTHEDVSDSGVMSLSTSEEPTSDSELFFSDQESYSPIISNLKYKFKDIIDKLLNDEDRYLFEQFYRLFQSQDCSAIDGKCSPLKIKNLKNKQSAALIDLPNIDLTFNDFKQVDNKIKNHLKSTESLQESGIFEENEFSNENSLTDWGATEHYRPSSPTLTASKGVQTDTTLIHIETNDKFQNKRYSVPNLTGELTLEILKLSEIQKRIQEKGDNENEEFSICGHKKHLKFYEERLKQLENKLVIYECSQDTKDKLLKQRLDHQILLERRFEELLDRLEYLETENKRLEQEKCEFEEAENDTRFQCQRLELKLQEVINKKSILRQEVQKYREMSSRKGGAKKVQEMYDRYGERKADLEEKAGEATHRLNMMDAAMPALLAWNMFRLCQNDNLTSQAAVEQVLGIGAGGFRTKDEDELVFDKLQELIDDQKRLREEYQKAEFAAEDRERKLRLRIQELEEKSQQDRHVIEEMTGSMTGLPQSTEGDEEGVASNASFTSIHSDDLAVFNELQELAENEVKLRKRIEELERKEQAYMQTLQQADEIWAGMEEEYKQRINQQEQQLNEAEESGSLMAEEVKSLQDENNKLKQCVSKQIMDEDNCVTVTFNKEIEDQGKKVGNLEMTLRVQIAGLEDEVADKVRRIADLEVTIAELREEVETLENALGNQEEQMAREHHDHIE